jgi:hypothetical protein
MSVERVRWGRGPQEPHMVDAIHVPAANLRKIIRVAVIACQEHFQNDSRMNAHLVALERFPEGGQLSVSHAKMVDMPIM